MEQSNMAIVEIEKRERRKYKKLYLNARGIAVTAVIALVILFIFLVSTVRANIRLQSEIKQMEDVKVVVR